MVANQSGRPVQDLKKFFSDAGSNLGGVKLVTRESEDQVDDLLVLAVINKRTKETILEGSVNDDPNDTDPNVGNYATFRSKTREGLALLKKIEAVSSHGFLALIEHSEIEMPVATGCKLVVVAGHGPEDEPMDNGLATRFTLYEGEEQVARCHLSYQDGSYDPSFGPTIEMMAVKQSHRGKGLIKVLWHWVRSYIEENFTIECLNHDAPVGHVMIKATQLTLAEVDVADTGKSFCDKDFFYNYCGFSARAQKGGMAMIMGSPRPIDEEAVLYVPLLSRQEIKQRSQNASTGPEIGDATFVENLGARCCDHCQRIRTQQVFSM